MDDYCTRCDRETCALLALLAEAGRVITPERVEARLAGLLAGQQPS